MTPRAPALPPQERRAAIITAAIPLVSSDGGGFTTRAVAEAAGIAEGTIYRIFDTKADLLKAVIEEVLDPTSLCQELAELRPQTLDEAVTEMVELLIDAVNTTSSFFTALHAHRSEEAPPSPPDKRQRAVDGCTRDDQRSVHERRAAQLHAAITAVLTPFDDQLRITPAAAASFLRSLVMASTHPFLSDGRISEIDQITALLLHGCAKESACS